MKHINAVCLALVLGWFPVLPAGAASADFKKYWESLREETELYSRAPSQVFEVGDNGGLLLRSGLSWLTYHRPTLLFARSSLLFSSDFSAQSFDILPCLSVGLMPVFAGVSCPLLEKGRSTPFNYEWGLSVYRFEGKVSTADFSTYNYYFSFTVPLGRMLGEARS